MNEHHDSAAEHYRAAGQSIVLMGVIALGLFALALLGDVELGFITAEGILVIGAIFLAVGGGMSLMRDA